MGHIGETAKRLYEMLHEVNRLAIPPTNRFEVVEAVLPPLHMVLDSLERHFTGMPFPLPKKALRVALFSNRLLQEVVTAYHATLNGEENASWFYRMTHTHIWLEAVHRIIYYLNHILANYRLLHRSVPGGLWLAIHTLYWTARDNRRHRDKVKPPLQSQATSIEAEYKRALLLSMLEPQLFKREQFEEVQANMPLWTQHCDLVMAKSRNDDQIGYCIRRDADAPHTRLTTKCCEECDGIKHSGLLLDLDNLSRFITDLLDQAEEGEHLIPSGGSAISQETLQTLAGCWRSYDRERLERKPSHAGAEVAIGMSSIFQLLKGETDSTARGISDQQVIEQQEGLRLLDENEIKASQNHGARLGARQEEDVWSTIFQATEIHQKSWSYELGEREYQFIPAQQRDFTASGYCLEFSKGEMEPFQAGELIGVRVAKERTIHLCMVRWLNEEDRTVLAGVMRLADSMEPAVVVLHHAGYRTPLYCLLGIGRDRKPQLFLPHLPGIQEKALFLLVDGVEVPLALHERVVVSPLFDAFHFQADTIPTDGVMSLQQMNQQLHALSHPKHDEMTQDDFSDLWGSL